MTTLSKMKTMTPLRTGRPRRSKAFALAALLAAFLPAAVATAQPGTRGAPVLKTPAPRPAAPGGAGAAAPGGATTPAPSPAAPPATPAPGGDAAADPMAAVKQGPKEIDFKPRPGGFMVSFNLEDADLNELVKAISNITGRRFIYGGKLRQIKATVYSPDKVSVAEAYSAFLSILETNGLTVIPHGRFLKIIETPGVVSQTTPVFGQATPVPNEDRFVTRLYRVSNVDPNEAANVLGKFKSKDGDITVYPPGNLVIMTDTGTNVQRMMRILEDVDVGGAGDQIYFEPVHYASAQDVATKLNELLGASGGGAGGRGGGAGGGGGRITADERTNSLVITANQPDYLRLLELIKRMDVPQSGEGQIHVLPLQHAGCKDLSATINQVLGGAAGGGAPAAGGRRGPAAPAAAATEDIFEGSVKVTCDEASNKLVVTSSLRDYAALRSVIDELDLPRRQVFIEAVIMDVNVDRTTDLGIGYHLGAPLPGTNFAGTNGDGLIYGGNHPQPSILGVPEQLGALALGVRGPTITGSSNLFGTGISIPAFGVVLHALATDSDSNVLATPHILATDNVKAEISIGQNIPLQTNVGGMSSLAGLGGAGAAAGAAGLGGLLGGLGGLGGFSAPRQDVGTKISVIPHINDSDQVRLELTEEISEAGAPQGVLGAIPIIKRQATTTLVVRDQQTVVIGGLVRDAVTNARTKIPILGDIPVLGALFRQTKKTTQKTNLLLVLTPYVIRDQDDLRAIFERKMQERQEFLDRYFVFGDSEWEPPRDFSRANGLVEDIRQSIIKEADRARIEEEAKPKGPRTHEPGQPIALPSMAAKGGGGAGFGGGASFGNVDDGAAPPPQAAPAAPGPRRVRAPGATTPRPPPATRVE
ncbi:type II secretion system secretin GspD [Polyangium aurulentum]|uniref:type II secretion system secretin GspD n=1 Tax=Polyangium aurulentum TaxID=2567896 RepID=UPI00200C323F|nr:type II secretion system secretin GspD [Polyangium aurulentum]